MWVVESKPEYIFGSEVEDDPRCDFCERSLVTRFGGWAGAECDSCRDEFARLDAAGKLVLEVA